MLHYPKIPGSRDCPLAKCIAFEKYDGTNMHWVWDRDFGWHAFGTRRDEFNLTPQGIEDFVRVHAHLAEAPGVFQETLAEGIDRVFRENPHYASFGELKAFAEFLGPGSFAGLHKSDDAKQLVLFDIWAEGFERRPAAGEGVGGLHLVALGGERLVERGADRPLVIHDQHRMLHSLSSSSGGDCPAARAGSLTRKVAPPARRLRGWWDALLGRGGSGIGHTVDLGPVPAFVARHLGLLRAFILVVAAFTLVVWNLPTGKVVLLIALCTLIPLALVQLLAGAGRAELTDAEASTGDASNSDASNSGGATPEPVS